MLREQLAEALKVAVKAREKRRSTTLRLILAAIKDRDIAGRENGSREGVSDEAILQILQKMVKQRQEAMQTYEHAGRLELVAQEGEEIEIIQDFLPQQMSTSEIETAVGEVLGELDCKGLKDMGRVMATLRERYAGRMDFGAASGMAKERLT